MFSNTRIRHNVTTGILMLLAYATARTPGAEPLYVFLLAGQSNMTGLAGTNGLSSDLNGKQENVVIYLNPDMDGDASRKGTWVPLEPGFGNTSGNFGPELGFGNAISDANTGRKIALFKSSVNGTNLDRQWRPPSSGGSAGNLYSSFTQELGNALPSLDEEYVITGMLWMQGESDAMNQDMANRYEENMENFITDIRQEVGVEDLPFILANIDEQSMWTYHTTVNGAMNTLAEEMTNVVSFPTKGFQTDGIHYQTTGMVDLGEAFAQAYLDGDFISTAVALYPKDIRRTSRPYLVENGAKAPAILFDLRGRKISRTAGAFRAISSGLLIAGRKGSATTRVLHVLRD